MNFDGKIAVVTGAAQGIGFSCSKLLVERGARVVIADIDTELGDKAQVDLGKNTLFVKTDVRNSDEVKSMVDEGVKHFGGIDILVNNAAVAIKGSVDEIDEVQWQTVIDTNLTGSLWLPLPFLS